MDEQTASSVCGLAKILWDDRTGPRACSAIVFEQASNTVRVSTTAELPRFGRVRITMGGLAYRATVESTGSGESGNESELALQETRRLDERLPRRGAMAMARADRDGESMTVQAANYSSGGFQVISPQPFDLGLPVRLSESGAEYFGIVRYCNPCSQGFLMGVELLDEPMLDD